MKKKPIFYLMCGLPGSGKSTFAKELKAKMDRIKGLNETVLLSSDELRKEMFGDENDMEHNGEVFNEMRRRTKENLKAGNNVIYDATNISSKRRTNFLKHELRGIECEKVCVYMPTIWYECIENDKKRDRQVGREVIIRMRNQLDIPMYNEGWDYIKIHKQGFIYRDFMMENFDFDTFEEYRKFLASDSLLFRCVGLNQNNPHHDFTLDEHMYKTYRYLVGCGANYQLRLAGLLHDIGKPYCQTTDENGISHYSCHERISAQLALNFLIERGNIPDRVTIAVATLIQNHMKFFNEETLKSLEEFLGEYDFFLLSLLHDADIKASKVVR